MADDAENKKWMESCIDIALNAGSLLAQGKIAAEDSRELVASIQLLATVFELTGYDEGDYIGMVDAFAQRHLLQEYGREPSSNDTQAHNEIFLLYACNEWRDPFSRRLVCACTDRETLYGAVANEIFEGRMGFDGLDKSAGVARFREAYRSGCIDFDLLEYGETAQAYNQTHFIPGQSQQRDRLYQVLQMDDEAFSRTNFAAALESIRDSRDEQDQDDDMEL